MSASARPALVYGSDVHGVLWAYRFRDGIAGEAISADEAFAEARGVSDGFVWLHADLSNSAAERHLGAQLDLPDAFYESLHASTRASRIADVGTALVASINDVLYDFSMDSSGDVATLHVAVTGRYVVTGRRKPLRSVDRLRAAVRRGESFATPVALLVHLLQDQSDVLAGIVRDATLRADQIEDRFLAERLDAQRTHLGALRRVLVRLRRVLAPEPTALFRLLSRPPRFVTPDDVGELRQATEELAVVLGDLAGLLERVKLLQDEVAASVGEQSNRLLLLLSIVTVIGLPFTVIGGLFGMNVAGIPLAEERGAFWIIVGIVAAATAGGTWLVFRQHRR